MAKHIKNLIVEPAFERIDERGILKEVINNDKISWSAVNWCSMKKDAIMGNHYHKKTVVFLFIIKGKSEIVIEDLKTRKRQVLYLKEGSGILLMPSLPHAVRFLSDSEFLMLKTKYDKKNPDIYEYEVI